MKRTGLEELQAVCRYLYQTYCASPYKTPKWRDANAKDAYWFLQNYMKFYSDTEKKN